MRSASLGPEVSESFDETVAKGVVISVRPGAGTNVRRGTDVVLVVSKGPERYAVPPIVGMTLAEATARIEAVKLAVGKVSKAFDEKVADGQVVSAKPGPAREPEEEHGGRAHREQGPQADRRPRPHRQARDQGLSPR